MPDWGKIAEIAIPAVVGGIGAIAGGKAKAGANQRSQAVIDKAYKDALAAYSTAHGQATDINNWMLKSSFAPLNFGYQQGRADFQNALLGGQQGLAAGQANIADILGPYTGAGRKGTAETNFLLYGAGQGSTPPPTAGNFPAPSPGSFQLPANFGGGFNIAPPPAGGSTGGGGSSPGGTNALTSFASHLADNKVKPGMLGAIGSAVGGVAGGIYGGPAGAAGGSFAGSFLGRLTRNGREKMAASDAANEFSDYIWNEVIPQAKDQGWDLPTLQNAVNAGKNDYSNWLGQTLKDKGVVQNSQTSQFGYLDKDLAGVYSGWGQGSAPPAQSGPTAGTFKG